MDLKQLQATLGDWRAGDRRALLRLLGYEPIDTHIPRASFPEFGLDPDEPLTFRIAARRGAFLVFLLASPDRFDAREIHRLARELYRHNPARRALLVFQGATRHLVFASWGLGPGPFRLLKLSLDVERPRRSELEILAGLAADPAATPTELALTHSRALDREALTRAFFIRFRRQRAELAASLSGVPAEAQRDRLDLALILMSRLLFLYFLQKKGWLDGDIGYLRNLFESSLRDGSAYYRKRLKPLFFGALNRPPEKRREDARKLGRLPYLNGGLFERDPLERRYPRLNVANEALAPIFDELLDRYQFTVREDQPADQDVAVDPEMLGRVFEGLMAGPARGASGAFYTPRVLVDGVVDETLIVHLVRTTNCPREQLEELISSRCASLEDAPLRARIAERVRSVRILDPAVGTGAFLLAALVRVERLRDALEGEPDGPFGRFQRRKEILRRNLFGVDINSAAVRLCELRLWLALVVDLEVEDVSAVPPLPNLGIQVRQGDALLDPIDFVLQLGGLQAPHLTARWQRALSKLEARRDRYFRAGGYRKLRATRDLQAAERGLALEFLAELCDQLEARHADLEIATRDRDLFGRRAGLTPSQRRTRARLRERIDEVRHLIQRIHEADELPFFSFPIHFADPAAEAARFDVVVGNPPWVRPHHWAGISRKRLKQRYRFLRDAGWRKGVKLSGAGRGFGAQLDLSALFLERSLELLDDRGTLGFLLPAKIARALYASAVRRHVSRSTTVMRVEDCALAHHRYFRATTYPMVLTVAAGRPPDGHRVRVQLHPRMGSPCVWHVRQRRLPLLPDDPESPWVLVPPDVRDTMDRMRRAGTLLGSEHRPRRGVLTGANRVFIGQTLEMAISRESPAGMHGCSDVVSVRFPAGDVDLERDRLRPLLRGEDLGPWRFSVQRVLLWPHHDNGVVLPVLPPATVRYLTRHERTLRARRDLRGGQLPWTLFRVRPEVYGLRVAWRDIASRLSAVVVPKEVPFLDGTAPLVSLNTVYQVPATEAERAHLLAAILNSTPARVYVQAIAQRAASGHFRFFGSTIALLPIPTRCDSQLTAECVRLSRHAHRAGRLSSSDAAHLDRTVGALYGLYSADIARLQSFDRQLTGERQP